MLFKWHLPARLCEGASSYNVGRLYPFILVDKGGSVYAPVREDRPEVCFFINKLDAAITANFEKNRGDNYIVQQIKPDDWLFKLLKLQQSQNIINFCIVYGYAAVNSAINPKWVSTDKNRRTPDYHAHPCAASEVEYGVDLTYYFCYTFGSKEREIALSNLIKTNLATSEEIDKLAQSILLDMQINTLQIADSSNQSMYHRVIGLS